MNNVHDKHSFGTQWNVLNMFDEQFNEGLREGLDICCPDVGINGRGTEGFPDFSPFSQSSC